MTCRSTFSARPRQATDYRSLTIARSTSSANSSARGTVGRGRPSSVCTRAASVILDGSQIPCAARRSPGLSGPQQKDGPWGWTCRRRCCARRPPAQQEGLTNVHFEHGDAQVSGFTPGAADVAVSRFGVMFFAEPAGAFANIAAGLRLGASARRWGADRRRRGRAPFPSAGDPARRHRWHTACPTPMWCLTHRRGGQPQGLGCGLVPECAAARRGRRD